MMAAAFVMGGVFVKVPAAHAAEQLASTTLASSTNLVSYYRFEGNLTDSASGGNDGTSTNLSYSTSSVSAGFGDAASFNGTSSYVNVGAASNLQLTGDFTISLWVYLKSYPAVAAKLIGKWNESGNNRSYGLAIDTSGRPYVNISSDGQNVGENYAQSTSSIPTDTWTLITWTRSGSSQNLYINGSSTASGVATNPYNSGTNSHLIMGGDGGEDWGGSNYFIDTNIDDVAIFNRALSAAEVSDLYTGDWPTVTLGSLHQYHADATTTIASGGATSGDKVVIGGVVDSNGSSTVQLQVDVEPAGTPFATTTGPNATSVFVTPGSEATATYSGANGSYHWRARGYDGSDSYSPWESFSGNPSSTDFVIAVPSALQLQSTTLRSDRYLVSYYRFEGNANDSASGGNDGTATNTSYRAAYGQFGEGAGLNGVSSKITVANNSNLNPSGSFTENFWIYVNAYSGRETLWAGKWGETNTQREYAVAEQGGGTGKISFLFAATGGFGTGSAEVDIAEPSTIAWHMITLVFNSGQNVEGYIDGTLVGSASTSATSVYGGTNPFEISNAANRIGGDSGGYLNGDIDDLSFFNRALTPSEVASLYSGIFSYYAQIENTSTLTLYDASSTTSSALKVLPADWIIYVASSTDPSGNPMIDASGNAWFKVMDPTDGVTGWMVASDTAHQYISSYDGSMQSAFEASSSDVLSTTSTRAAAIVDAVQNYYTNSSTMSSLNTDEYADGSANLSDVFNLSNATSVPEVLVYGMAAQESGGIGFDNTNVKPFYPAYGYGIMQLTAIPTSSDVYNLEVLLNKNSSTQVEASGPGSPGDETHDFTSDVTAAVKTFQSENGIATTGNVFFLTRSALNALLPTSSIPSDFRFNTNIAQGDDDRLSGPSSPLGRVSGVLVPPCSNLQDPSNVSYYQDCLGESSTSTPNQYYAPQPNYDNQTFEWYGNTIQSIYSSIKDALGVMRTKWYTWAPCTYGDLSFSAPGFATTTFTCNDRLNILSVWGYNGFATSSYLSNVANQLNGENIQNTFPTANIPTSTSAEWYNKLKIGQANEFQFEQDSPVDSAVVDSEGRITGIVDGKLEVQIPDSAYNTRTHSGMVLFPQDTYTFRVQGDATGTYGFTVQSNDHSPTSTIFHIDNFPTSPGAIHEYSIDFKKLEKGEPGITLKIDDTGNGKIDRVLTGIGTVSTEPAQTYPAPLLTPPIVQQPAPAPKPQPPVRIFESVPSISTSTSAYSSPTLLIASSTMASSSLVNLASTTEIASSTMANNSSTGNNE